MATRTVDLGSVIGPQGPKGDTGPAGPQGPAAPNKTVTISGTNVMLDENSSLKLPDGIVLPPFKHITVTVTVPAISVTDGTGVTVTFAAQTIDFDLGYRNGGTFYFGGTADNTGPNFKSSGAYIDSASINVSVTQTTLRFYADFSYYDASKEAFVSANGDYAEMEVSYNLTVTF